VNKAKKAALSGEINVVSELSLDAMIGLIESLEDKTTRVMLQPLDEDTVQFRLVYVRQGRSTAGVSGQVRRWAGSMSHVVCSGETIHHRRWHWRRWLLVSMAVLVSLPLIGIASGNLVTGISAFLMYTGLVLGTLCLLALYEIWRRFEWNRVPEQRFAAHQTGIPHYKDREHLLEKIVSCVKSSEAAPRLTLPNSAENPLPIVSPQESAREQK
jgi:hypothetical protein